MNIPDQKINAIAEVAHEAVRVFHEQNGVDTIRPWSLSNPTEQAADKNKVYDIANEQPAPLFNSPLEVQAYGIFSAITKVMMRF